MKKILRSLMLALLAVCLIATTLVGCGGSGWDPKNVTIVGSGDGQSNGGFIATTNNGENVYFINGVGTSSEDNTLGKPQKGALMVAKKDMSATSIVVPKLFTSADKSAGFYIFNDYVYYGTPSTDKDSSGNIASNQMMITRTKLDGTGTETLFTLSALDAQFRVIELEEKVYIVYYDTEDTALKCYNVSTKQTTVIAKNTIEAQKEALQTFKFMNNGVNDLTILYTTVVYSEAYNEDIAEDLGEEYTRAEEKYNRVYAYKVGDDNSGELKGTLVLDGKKDEANGKYFDQKFTVDFITDNYLFYSVADSTQLSQTKTMAISFADLVAKAPATEVKATAYAKNTSLIVSLEEVYAFETDRIKKANLVTGDVETVALLSSVTTLYAVEGDYAYYLNSSNQLARIKVKNVDQNVEADLNEHRVSTNIINNDWYRPEIIDGKIYYVDNSSKGLSYVYFVDLNATVLEKDTNDDDEIDLWYLEDSTFLGKRTESDQAEYVSATIAELTNTLEDGKLTDQTKTDVIAVREEFNKLNNAQKDIVTEAGENTLIKYEKAIELEKELKNISGFGLLDEAGKTALKTKYEAVKALINALKPNDDGIVLSEVTDMIDANLMYDYQLAKTYFAK